jgi:hypothetical protein
MEGLWEGSVQFKKTSRRIRTSRESQLLAEEEQEVEHVRRLVGVDEGERLTAATGASDTANAVDEELRQVRELKHQ